MGWTRADSSAGWVEHSDTHRCHRHRQPADVRHRRIESGRAANGFVVICAKAGSPCTRLLATAFAPFVQICEASFARVDSPTWGHESSSNAAFPQFNIHAQADWLLRERAAWKMFLSPYALTQLPDDAVEQIANHGGSATMFAGGGAIVQIAPHEIRDSSTIDITLLEHAAGCLSVATDVQ